jgi:hypothetical protein
VATFSEDMRALLAARSWAQNGGVSPDLLWAQQSARSLGLLEPAHHMMRGPLGYVARARVRARERGQSVRSCTVPAADMHSMGYHGRPPPSVLLCALVQLPAEEIVRLEAAAAARRAGSGANKCLMRSSVHARAGGTLKIKGPHCHGASIATA